MNEREIEMACAEPDAPKERWWEWPLALSYITGAVTIIVTVWAMSPVTP